MVHVIAIVVLELELKMFLIDYTFLRNFDIINFKFSGDIYENDNYNTAYTICTSY